MLRKIEKKNDTRQCMFWLKLNVKKIIIVRGIIYTGYLQKYAYTLSYFDMFF